MAEEEGESEAGVVLACGESGEFTVHVRFDRAGGDTAVATGTGAAGGCGGEGGEEGELETRDEEGDTVSG